MKKLLVPLKTLSAAESAYQNLKGVFSIYKPPDLDIQGVYSKLKRALYQGINELPNRSVESIVKIDDNKDLVYVDTNLADTELGYNPFIFF
jgi:hypothetical protein